MTIAAAIGWWQDTGALSELKRRLAMEAGLLPPPHGTTREERCVEVRLRSTSINEVALRSRSFDRHKVDLQGKLMREFHGLQYLLPRPIPSVGEDGGLAPVWAHARLRFPKRAGRDVENYRTLVSKALGDALTGPFTRWVGSGPSRRMVDAERTLIYRGRAYKGRWLEQDTDRHWLLTMDFDPELGPARLLVWLVWDEPATPRP